MAEERPSVRAQLNELTKQYEAEKKAKKTQAAWGMQEVNIKEADAELAEADMHEENWDDMNEMILDIEVEKQEVPNITFSREKLIGDDEETARKEAYSLIDTARGRAAQDMTFFQNVLDNMGNLSPQAYSVNNFLLATAQGADSIIREDNKWHEMDCHVLPGSSPVIVLEPATAYNERTGKETKYYYPKRLYAMKDVRNSEGVMPEKRHTDRKKELELLVKSLQATGVKMYIATKMPDKVDARFCPEDNAIYIREGVTYTDRLYRSIAKEAVHARAFAANNEKFDRKNQELEAGLVSYILCTNAGMDVKSMGFDFDVISRELDGLGISSEERTSLVSELISAVKSDAEDIMKVTGKIIDNAKKNQKSTEKVNEVPNSEVKEPAGSKQPVKAAVKK